MGENAGTVQEEGRDMSRRMRRTAEEFPEAIKEQMGKRGLDVKPFADILGVTPQAVNAWLRGGGINKRHLRQIEDVLNLVMTDTPSLSKQETSICREADEQLELRLREDEALEDEEEKAPKEDPWTYFHPTNKDGCWRGIKDGKVYILMRQQYKKLKKKSPFVMAIAPLQYDDSVEE